MLVAVLAVLVLVLAASLLWANPVLIVTALALAVVIAVLDLYPIPLPGWRANGVEFTVSGAVKIAAVILMPPASVLFAIGLGTLLAEWRLKRVWFKLVFNVGTSVLDFTIVAWVYQVLNPTGSLLLQSLQNIAALVAVGIGEVLVNGTFMALVLALVTGLPVTYVWAQNSRPLILHNLSMLPLGVLIVLLWQYSPWTIVLALLPLAIIRHSSRMVMQLQRQTREALAALAHILDERDEHTSRHSELVAEHAELIARGLGLGPEEVDTIARAAALHDIGKVGMRNDILFKAGTLTLDEREEAKRHALIGGELLKKFPLFEKGAIYVRHHHERWDGTGYPDGLKGEAIPLGARILTVADSFQAMIEDRPYRRPLTLEQAFNELVKGAGTQFDPRVVDILLRAKGSTLTVQPPVALQEPTAPLVIQEQTQPA